ncbi:MAG: alpha/beta hydrolase [Woeseiaceae bacterium]|nr:alpha/beta hydrolase [Woeseiaceae bacterium]
MTAVDTVVCVHGIWSHGSGMYLVKRRLEKEFGFRAFLFSYRSIRGTLDENAAALADFIHRQKADGVHVIGHSLGGVLALRMFANDPNALPGRVVCLGSPLTGSRAAELLHETQWAEEILGRTLPAAVIHQSANDWASQVCRQRDVGVIAGTMPLGVGRLFAQFDGDNDGTVAVSETRLEGARDHLVMRVSHRGLLVSTNVADQAAAFLKRGEFLREP